MKKIFLFGSILSLVALAACDKVTNPYPAGLSSSGEIDWSLYPDGDSANYAQNHWPTFTANTNTLRNVLIEDLTGHTCNNCPPAAIIAENLSIAHPNRVYVATLHTGPTGMGSLQVPTPEYPTDWTNAQGLEIGTFFGSIPGSAFQGNPRGTVNRVTNNSQLTAHPTSWTSMTNAALATTLKVNLQAEHNYFASTRGLFLHTEVDVLDPSVASDLKMVVYLIEDSLVGDQKMSDNSHNTAYVHREIMRGCIDGRAFGKSITPYLNTTNGKYYLDYSYKLPSQYAVGNVHVLIYVFNQNTYEIYQVIKEDI